MSNTVDMKRILWHNQDNHDKVWCWFIVLSDVYCAWGRRGKKLSFKRHTSKYSAQKVEYQKENKGYKDIDAIALFTLFPDFEQQVEEQLLMKTLSGKIM